MGLHVTSTKNYELIFPVWELNIEEIRRAFLFHYVLPLFGSELFGMKILILILKHYKIFVNQINSNQIQLISVLLIKIGFDPYIDD